jgi:hypothetical protein
MRSVVCVAAVLLSGCSLASFFEQAPECEEGETRVLTGACGPCLSGTLTEVCGHGRQWVPAEDGCEDPSDADQDGFPNFECVLGGPVDCNDDNPAVFPGATGLEECTFGTRGECTTSYGTPGTRTCDAACMWSACTAQEACRNLVDDDCDTATDEIDPGQCTPGTTVPCTTTCDSTGVGTCTEGCLAPDAGACTPPAESCNVADDDCDTQTDEDFLCVPGLPASCTTTCGSAGTGICTAACERPEGIDCTAPVETCDGRDEDCDGVCDNGVGTCCDGAMEMCTTTGGRPGVRNCSLCAWGDCIENDEACNGVDDDGDGAPDDGLPCVQNQGVSCNEGEALPCHPITCTTSCGSTGTGVCSSVCGLPTGAACVPPLESCNAVDDDCDGTTDEIFTCVMGATQACTTGGCSGSQTCTSSCAWGTCVGTEALPTTPVPFAPPNGTITGVSRRQPEFRWSAATGCGTISYHFQADDSCTTPGFASCTFPSPEIDTTSTMGTTYRSTTPMSVSTTRPVGRRYYWRVQACDGSGRCGSWSAVRYVDVGRAPCDFDGDGYSDLVVGGLLTNTHEGTVYIFRGGAPPSTTPALTMSDPTMSNEEFGRSTACAGDVNADGFGDWLVGAPSEYLYGSRVGRVHLFFGGSVLDSTVDVIFTGASSELFGASVAGAGDVNADGFADIAVGAPGHGPNDRGQVTVFLGGTAPDTVPDLVVPGTGACQRV